MKKRTGNIEIKGARVHNLKDVSLKIPHNKLVVITGVSGSGKSSLAFDTLFAEGQRRYVESLSSYARQFLGRLDKPDVDYIKGISPAIAIQQKVISSNPRSTVGTVTEIYDYLKVLFARIGKTYSPISGEEVRKDTVSSVVDEIMSFVPGDKFLVLSPWNLRAEFNFKKNIEMIAAQGHVRYFQNDRIGLLTEMKEKDFVADKTFLVIDRLKKQENNPEFTARLADSIQTAFFEGFGHCYIFNIEQKQLSHYSNRFERDGILFIEPSINLFTFNNPFGACKKCEGFGSIIGIDHDLVVPDKSKSLYEDAVAPWKSDKMRRWKDQFIDKAARVDFPIHKPYMDLDAQEKSILWDGNKEIKGIQDFFDFLKKKSYKIHHRILMARYRGKTTCDECMGTRLRKETQYVKIDNYTLSELLLKPISSLEFIFEELNLGKTDFEASKRLLKEIQSRISFLNKVGLGYLTLNRQSSTLSGGESQRIHLATALGSSLVGSMYILDEPSIGLHPKDTNQLIDVLLALRDIGNTVIVVEHEEDVMRSADEIIDIGPEAGKYGGEVVFKGNHDELLEAKRSLTADYLSNKIKIEVPSKRRNLNHFLRIKGARQYNLKNFDVDFPLNGLTCVSGVSGSGKSTLIKDLLYPLLAKSLGVSTAPAGECDGIEGDISFLDNVEFIDQNPIGRSSRSNPATYVKAFDHIRELFSKQQLSKIRGYKPGHFSYNVPGGRCETCKGEGEITISMQFMADVKLTCEECNGRRYTPETLDVRFKEKTIYDVLEMPISEALIFFDGKTAQEQKIRAKIGPLEDLGLGYLTLGQSSSTLSGGEAQRVKLASFLNKGQKVQHPTLFIFDEPTTGLHFHDIKKLVKGFNELIKIGHSVICIEHNMDVLKNADWIIDLGPDGGENGGELVFAGRPEEIVNCSRSYTGLFLKTKIS